MTSLRTSESERVATENGLLVLFLFLLNVAYLFGDCLQRVFKVAILCLQVCRVLEEFNEWDNLSVPCCFLAFACCDAIASVFVFYAMARTNLDVPAHQS